VAEVVEVVKQPTRVVSVQGVPTRIVTVARAVGPAGRQVELGVVDDAVAWRYVGDESWWAIVPLSDLTGPEGPAGADGAPGADGREVVLRVSGGYVQWQHTGDSEWTNLIAVADLKGPQGDPGDPGASAYDLAVADGFEGTIEQWLASLHGAPGEPGEAGEPGAPGKSAYELAVEEGFEGTLEEWLASVQGEPGPKGDPGVGVPAGGTTGQVLGKVSSSDYDTGWVDPPTGGEGLDAEGVPAGWVPTAGGDDSWAWGPQAGGVPAPQVTVVEDATGEGTVELAPGFMILSVGYSGAARFRLYRTALGRLADQHRAFTTRYMGGAGLLYDYLAAGAQVDLERPVPGGYAPGEEQCYWLADGGPVTVTITWVPTTEV
jgi:hypothetical protein